MGDTPLVVLVAWDVFERGSVGVGVVSLGAGWLCMGGRMVALIDPSPILYPEEEEGGQGEEEGVAEALAPTSPEDSEDVVDGQERMRAIADAAAMGGDPIQSEVYIQ